MPLVGGGCEVGGEHGVRAFASFPVTGFGIASSRRTRLSIPSSLTSQSGRGPSATNARASGLKGG